MGMNRGIMNQTTSAMHSNPPNSELYPSSLPVRLSVSRSRAFERALLTLPAGLFLVFLALQLFSGLRFTPTAVSNRITDYSLAAVLVPVGLLGVFLSFRGFRWLLLAIWPADLAIIAGADELVLRLGPLGTRRFDTARLTLKYPYELSLSEDDEDALYESLLDDEVQIARFLPRMIHPLAPDRLDREILRWTRLNEQQCVAALRPFIEYVRPDVSPIKRKRDSI